MFQESVLPSQVFLSYLALNVKLPMPRPSRRFKCHHFGHVQDKCRAEVRCPTCGGLHEVNNCSQNMKCCNCGCSHLAGFKGCVVYQ